MTQTTPLISIVIPFYNAEDCINRSLNSVINQSYKNIELILINDGSTDNSNAIVKKISAIHTGIHLIYTSNKGPGNARNIGIKTAKGTYIIFLDADDELLPNMVLEMHKNISFFNTNLAVCMYKMYGKNHQLLKHTQWKHPLKATNLQAIELLTNEELIPTVWGKIFVTSLAKKCYFPSINWKEDDIFMLQYLSFCKHVSFINEAFIFIHCKSNSLTRQTISTQMITDVNYSYKKQHQLIEKYHSEKLHYNLIKSQLRSFLLFFLIIKIDWNKINNKTEFLKIYKNNLTKFIVFSKNYTFKFKQKIMLFLLIMPKYFGWKFSLFFVSFLKKETTKQLKKVKYIN